MSAPDEPDPTRGPRGWLHGLGEVAAFFWACTVALANLVTGRWPKFPKVSEPIAPEPPTEGMNLIEKIAPFPGND